MKKKFLFFTLIILTSVFIQLAHANTAVLAPSLSPPIHPKLSILIDPGHGGHDQGAASFLKLKKITEANLNLQISQKIYDLLTKSYSNEFNTMISRTDDNYVSLLKRVEKAELNDVDIYIGIHCNSTYSENISGTEIYFSSDKSKNIDSNDILESIKNDLVETGRIKQSLILAKLLPKNWPHTQIKIRRAPFFVINKNKSIALLIEVGYMTNLVDKNLLTNTDYQDKIAESIISALLKYRNLSDKITN